MTPALASSLRGYSAADLRADLWAGITVAMVALPLSLAIAIASGAGPETGLITAVVAGFLISALGGSRVQVGGPTGAFIVVVADVIARHGFSGLVTATFMAGLILLVAGLLRAGKLIRFVPEPVINGFTIGIAAIIALSQLKDLLGLTGDLPAEAVEKIAALWQARGAVESWALATGLATMALITLFRRLAPAWPGLIVAVALVSGAVALFDLPVATLGDRFGTLPRGLPMPALPTLDLATLRALLPSALIIAFLAGVESLLSAMVADRMTGDRHRSGAELLAQGWANLASALMGGLPATGAIARTATNIRAGARSPVAGMVHAVAILGAMAVAAPLASALAMPALAGLLILTAWNMSEPQHWRAHATTGPMADRLLLALTCVLTVLADLTVAIGLGVALGLALRLQRRASAPDWQPPDR
ncbi:SulP family inorganic anion transporter [Salipiger marinus]|uniref:SulP family inorganic anion transporter n=1 Tax=Salipiger marinus TaxID=555512 RepID=UPI002B687693|nr:SulP family inorganic anion transporter [Salipiger manganoxidans]MEB3418140.1 SulP family inorganic anion transporter [Salipiger manganoxidans]